MTANRRLRTHLLLLSFALVLPLLLPARMTAAVPDPDAKRVHHIQVIVPEEDRFTPFSQTIRAGEAVRWINMDTDDHTVVSDDSMNTAGPHKINLLLKGTDSNNGKPGQLQLSFPRPGVFVYYCRFHAHLDADHQPVAPGPDGGIQSSDGNFGTPMMGIITVLPAE
jgi:plastocyanin